MMFLFNNCNGVKDTFRSKILVSSKGEKLYINTLSWGVTDDNQYTIITKDAGRLKNRTDTVSAINGLSPFVYRFRGDTLSVFYLEWKEIDIKERFKSIKIDYNPLENREYRSEEHTSELQSRENLVCRLLLEKKKII